MARQAIKTADDPKAIERSAREARARARVDGTSGKTFEQLNQKEKDRLLKALLIRNGLVVDSEDED